MRADQLTVNPPILSRQSIISDLYESSKINGLINRMDPDHLREDLRQEVFRVICELKDDKLKALYNAGQLEYYTIGTITKMVKSDRSTFYRTFRKFDEKFKDGSDKLDSILKRERAYDHAETDVYYRLQYDASLIEETIPETRIAPYVPHLSAAMSALYWYEAKMLQLYFENGNSCKPIAKQTGIPLRNVQKAIKNAKDNLKTILSTYVPE